MPVVHAPPHPTHQAGETRFTSLATPSSGARETSVWRVVVPAVAPAVPHTLTREEVLVVLGGTARVRLGAAEETAGAGDAIVVPPGVAFELSSAGEGPLELLCCMPVGGQARLADGTVFTPPWAR